LDLAALHWFAISTASFDSHVDLWCFFFLGMCLFASYLFSQVPNFFWRFFYHVKFREPVVNCYGVLFWDVFQVKTQYFFFGFERNCNFTFVTNSSWSEPQSA